MGYLEILWIINSTFAKGGISLLPLCPVCKALVMRIIKQFGKGTLAKAICGQICLVAGAENTKNKLKKVIKTII